jgi:hypothetical protein
MLAEPKISSKGSEITPAEGQNNPRLHFGSREKAQVISKPLTSQPVRAKTSCWISSSTMRSIRVQFHDAFDQSIGRVRGMTARYVMIDCPLMQHMFEVYAAISLRTPFNEFTTS